MDQSKHHSDAFTSRRLKLATLTNTRWFAVLGQSIVLAIVAGYLGFPLPILACFSLVAVSAVLNIFVTWRFPANQRLDPNHAFAILLFDAVQLAALLYLTGGLENPFSILLIVPAIISAASLPVPHTVALGILVALVASVLVEYHLPLPWIQDHPIRIPFVLLFGTWAAIISTLLFATFYVYRVAAEARRLADALAATELVMQREQHLSALDGLAAAAAHELGTPLATISLVAKELDRATASGHEFKDDIELLRLQADRCREILGRLSTLGTDDEDPSTRLPLTVMIEEIVAPHRDFGIDIQTVLESQASEVPIILRNTGLIYGLGNIVENAVDFAKAEVRIFVNWSNGTISLRVQDDGPGFVGDQMIHLGEPDIRSIRGSTRNRKGGAGLGLGVFIAKNLIERGGASVKFANSSEPGVGAEVTIKWAYASATRQIAYDLKRKLK